jgi:methyl-accepting chemotaxis protein
MTRKLYHHTYSYFDKEETGMNVKNMKNVKISPQMMKSFVVPSAVIGTSIVGSAFSGNDALLVGTTTIGAVGLVGLGVFNSIQLSKKMNQLNTFVKKLEEGDFTQTIEMKGKDELSQIANSLNVAIQNMRNLMGEVKKGVTDIDSQTEELSATMIEMTYIMDEVKQTTDEMAKGAEELSASIQEISASAEEIESSISNLAQKANQGREFAEKIKEHASVVKSESQKASENAYTIYEEKQEKILQAIEQAKIVEEIKLLADTIGDIAEQTNLLSLNASIEAARAGEHGRGFSVVANEVRKLAEQSAKSVDNIRKIVNEVQNAFTNLTANAKEILQFIDEQVKPDYQRMIEVGNKYEKDAEFIKQMSDEIAFASQTMADAITGVNMSIQHVSAATQQAASGTEEILHNISEVTLAVQEISETVQHQHQLARKVKEATENFQA